MSEVSLSRASQSSEPCGLSNFLIKEEKKNDQAEPNQLKEGVLEAREIPKEAAF